MAEKTYNPGGYPGPLGEQAPESPQTPLNYPDDYLYPQSMPPVARSDTPVGPPAPAMADPVVGPQMGEAGTQTTQFQGEASPTTRYVPIGPRQGEMPSWYTNYETERKAFLAQRKAENEAWSMAQQMSANKELEASYTKAMQLEGSLGFASAVQAGVPVQQALAQYAPKMYWNNPSASSHALTGVMDNMARTKRMNEPLGVRTVDGVRFATGGGMTPRPLPDVASRASAGQDYSITSTPALDPRGQLSGIEFRLERIDKQILALNMLNDSDPEKAIAKKELNAEKKRLDDMYRNILESSPTQRTTERVNKGRSVASQSEFDALPSGATYTGKDGRNYRKP